MPSNVPSDFSRSPHENDSSIHEFAKAIIFDLTASLLVAYINAGVKPMDTASEAVLALKPVIFHYNSAKTCTPQFGLIAEEVAAVDSDLVL